MFGAAALVVFACRLSSGCCFPTGLASSWLRLPESPGLMQQHTAELSIPPSTPRPRGAVLLHGRSGGLTHPGSRLRLNGPCRAWIWNWQQTHRVLFVNIDLRLQDGHGRALLHSFTHTRPEVGPCEVGALMLQRTSATNRGTARG